MSDLAILIVLSFVGLLPALATPRPAQLAIIASAAVGVFAFLFIIPTGPDSPFNLWMAALLLGVILGAAIRGIFDRLRNRAGVYGHG